MRLGPGVDRDRAAAVPRRQLSAVDRDQERPASAAARQAAAERCPTCAAACRRTRGARPAVSTAIPVVWHSARIGCLPRVPQLLSTGRNLLPMGASSSSWGRASSPTTRRPFASTSSGGSATSVAALAQAGREPIDRHQRGDRPRAWGVHAGSARDRGPIDELQAASAVGQGKLYQRLRRAAGGPRRADRAGAADLLRHQRADRTTSTRARRCASCSTGASCR